MRVSTTSMKYCQKEILITDNYQVPY